MQVTKNTTYHIKFCVVSFEGTEGGMCVDHFGDEVDTIAEALDLLETANAKDSSADWRICLNVDKKISKISG
jgi:hypothetical protein